MTPHFGAGTYLGRYLGRPRDLTQIICEGAALVPALPPLYLVALF